MERAERAFYETHTRGPDMSRFYETERGMVGFHRLAIMGLNAAGMQPFTRGKNFCVCNGELYGFRSEKEQLQNLDIHSNPIRIVRFYSRSTNSLA